MTPVGVAVFSRVLVAPPDPRARVRVRARIFAVGGSARDRGRSAPQNDHASCLGIKITACPGVDGMGGHRRRSRAARISAVRALVGAHLTLPAAGDRAEPTA